MKMKRVVGRYLLAFFTMSAALLLAQDAAEWPSYGRDPGGTKYSPLDQINTKNVSALVRAWSYHTGEPGGIWENTPIVVGGRTVFRYPKESRGRVGTGDRQGALGL